MSLSADDIAFDQSLVNGYFIFLVQFTFVAYDWIITFDQEIRVVWKHLNRSCILFLVNRYALVASLVVQLAMYFGPQTAISCQATGNITVGLLFVLFSTIGIFSAQRVYAITDKMWLPALVVLCLGLLPAAFNLYASIELPFGGVLDGRVPFGGCVWFNNTTIVMNLVAGLTSRIAAVLGDAIVLAITWWKMYAAYKNNRMEKFSHRRFGVTDTMLVYGTAYFGAMLAFNIYQLIFDFVRIGNFDLPYQIAQMNQPIANILISRFILDLKTAHLKETECSMVSLNDLGQASTFIPAERPTYVSEGCGEGPRRKALRIDEISLDDIESGPQSVEGSDTIVDSTTTSPMDCGVSQMAELGQISVIEQVSRRRSEDHV